MSNDTMSELAKNKLLITELEGKLQISEESLKASQDTIEAAKQLSNRVQEKQKEYITILGIFASIVLAFTGGMVFSSSVL